MKSTIVVLLVLSFSSFATAATTSTDVLVYGATPAGIAAAVSSADAGHQVLLVEPTSRVGGLLTNGLSNADFRSFESLSGFFWDFSKRVESHYREKYGAESKQLKDCFRGTHGEPSVNLKVLEAMLVERPQIRVVKQATLTSVQLSDFKGGHQRFVSATFTPDLQVKAKQFIDASYEGDLMAMAGENFHVGRESSGQYGEPMAGDGDGQADGQVQGFNYRFIMTQVESNKLMPSAPDGYNRDDFVGVLPHFQSKTLTKVFSDGHDGIYRAHMPLLPNGKADVNDTPKVPVRLSMPDINDAYPNGDAKLRAEIVRQHFYYNVGLLYFLQNDEAVPPEIQSDARKWGFCKDEFVLTGGVPEQLYIREARRLVGQHVFTGQDTEQVTDDARSTWQTESIACGDYIHNCHGTGRKGTRFDGQHEGEFYKPVPPYQIQYGVIVPTKTTNLLVPVACSSSHFGFGALRLEPIWSSLGQAAGEAAALAIETNADVQSVDVSQLQSRLQANRSATIYVSDVAPDSPDFAAVQWLGTQGGLHGLAGANQPKAKSLGGQYSKAHPGHSVELGNDLDRGTYDRWSKRVSLPAFQTNLTRREAIEHAYQSN